MACTCSGQLRPLGLSLYPLQSPFRPLPALWLGLAPPPCLAPWAEAQRGFKCWKHRREIPEGRKPRRGEAKYWMWGDCYPRLQLLSHSKLCPVYQVLCVLSHSLHSPSALDWASQTLCCWSQQPFLFCILFSSIFFPCYVTLAKVSLDTCSDMCLPPSAT